MCTIPASGHRQWLGMPVSTANDVPARRPLPAMALALVLGLVLGTVVFQFVNAGIALVWESIPHALGSIPAWYVLVVLLLAAVLVYLARVFIADPLHSALDGFSIKAMTPRQYLGAILAILASLWGGMVLGPEVALVATGSLVGTLAVGWFKVHGDAQVKQVISLGALGAILALFVGPMLSGSASVENPPPSIEYDQLAWAVGVALVVGVAITLARFGGALSARLAGHAPHLVVLVVAALVVGLSAIAMQSLTGESALYVLTSGEELLSELPTLTSISTVFAIFVFKTIGYAASLGSGFRGGPFFPGMFIGATVGLLSALALPDGPSVEAGMVVGVVAAVIATAPMKWRTAIVLGAAIGFVMGGWVMMPAAVVGAAVSRAVPRWGDRVVTSIEGPANTPQSVA